MITSKLIELEYTNDNMLIEQMLRRRGIEPLRWAVCAVDGGKIFISVSYVKQKTNII